MLPFITTYKSVQVSHITFLKRLSGDTKSNSTWRIYISVTSDVNSSRTLVSDPKFLVFLIFWMCQHKMWCLFDMSASCDIVNEASRESPKILMDLIVHAVNLHLIRTQVHHRHTFPYLLLYLSESLHILKLTDHPALYFYENVSYFKAIVCSWSESNAHISWKRPLTQGYAVKFKKAFIVSGFVFPETDPDFLQTRLFCGLLRSSFFFTLGISRFYFNLADHVADRWGEECSMRHEVGRLFA